MYNTIIWNQMKHNKSLSTDYKKNDSFEKIHVIN